MVNIITDGIKNINKVHPVCKIMKCYFDEYVKLHLKTILQRFKNDLDENDYVQLELIDFILKIHQDPLIYVCDPLYESILLLKPKNSICYNNGI